MCVLETGPLEEPPVLLTLLSHLYSPSSPSLNVDHYLLSGSLSLMSLWSPLKFIVPVYDMIPCGWCVLPS